MARGFRTVRYHRLFIHFSCAFALMFLIIAVSEFRMSNDDDDRYAQNKIKANYPDYGKAPLLNHKTRRANGSNVSKKERNSLHVTVNGSKREQRDVRQSHSLLGKPDNEHDVKQDHSDVRKRENEHDLKQNQPDLRKHEDRDDFRQNNPDLRKHKNDPVCPVKRRNYTGEVSLKVGLPAIKHRPYGDVLYTAPNTCPPRVQYYRHYRGLPQTALVSYPGSGNTWLRHLLQVATGWLGFQIPHYTYTCKRYAFSTAIRFHVWGIKRHFIASLKRKATPLQLTHCGQVTLYGDIDLGQHWLRNDLLPDDTKSLLSILTSHQWRSVAFTSEQFHKKCS